jgi:hypothetical protein
MTPDHSYRDVFSYVTFIFRLVFSFVANNSWLHCLPPLIFHCELENSGIKPLLAIFILRLRRREKKLKRYLKILACKNGKADSSKGLYRLPPLEKCSIRLYPFEDSRNVPNVINLNNSTRVCDAGIQSRLAGLDLHGSAKKWVAEFESGSVFGGLFRNGFRF